MPPHHNIPLLPVTRRRPRTRTRRQGIATRPQAGARAAMAIAPTPLRAAIVQARRLATRILRMVIVRGQPVRAQTLRVEEQTQRAATARAQLVHTTTRQRVD